MSFRGQPFAFDSPAAAVAALIARAGPTSSARPRELVALDQSAGRILAEDILADRDSPAFDYSAMDGYAVCAADLAVPTGSGEAGSGVTLSVVAESRIGERPPALLHGSGRPAAVRIATGAPIPPGADSVVRREDVTEHAGEQATEIASIRLTPQATGRIRRGDHVRRRGENAAAGAVVLRRGEVITAAALATLAAVGITWPAVLARLRVAVITTGDELIPPDQLPSPFQLRNSNASAVRAIIASHTWANVTQVTHIRDDEDLVGALEQACGVADAVVLTGGVSMGHRDPVRAAVEQARAEIVFHGLPQRPGKPMLGGVVHRPGQHTGETLPVFGLPGNPVSAAVTCVRVVLPVLAACAGARRTPPGCLPGLIEVQNTDGRTLDLWWHRLVRLVVEASGPPRAELIDGRGSGDIVAAGMSDGFVEIPPGSAGTVLPFYAWPARAGSPDKDVS